MKIVFIERMLGAFGVWAAAMTVGCRTVGPDYRPPVTAVPSAWGESGAASQTVVTNGAAIGAAAEPAADQGAASLSRWWSVFRDPVLSDLMARACRDNRDLQQAEARLRQARGQRELALAERRPTVSASGSAGRSRGSEAAGGGRTTRTYANALDASWEADLFGGKRRAVESAEASLQASREARNDVLVSLAAEVALNYVEYRDYQARLEITQTNLVAQEETYAITGWRKQANLVTQLDVDEARMSLEQTRAGLPALQTGLEQSAHQIATLLGQSPRSLRALLEAKRPVPLAAEELAVGVPADLLRRRPDVRQAERELAAQTAEIGVAEAERYPDLTLSGSIGLEALHFGDLYTVAARTASGAVKAGWTLFDGGQIRQKVAVQTAKQEEALAAYEASVLTALKDVEDALVAYANEQRRRSALREAEAAGRSAFALARDKYAAGLTDFQTVLTTQQSLLTLQDSLASSDAEVTSDLIRLYKALGGGWEPFALEAGETTVKH